MDKELVSLPGWIIKYGKKFYVLKTMLPLRCENCLVEWYPRIERSGEIIIPGTCPNCRTAAWRKKR